MNDKEIVKITCFIGSLVAIVVCIFIISLSLYYYKTTIKAFESGYQHGSIAGQSGYCWVKVVDSNNRSK